MSEPPLDEPLFHGFHEPKPLRLVSLTGTSVDSPEALDDSSDVLRHGSSTSLPLSLADLLVAVGAVG